MQGVRRIVIRRTDDGFLAFDMPEITETVLGDGDDINEPVMIRSAEDLGSLLRERASLLFVDRLIKVLQAGHGMNVLLHTDCGVRGCTHKEPHSHEDFPVEH